ncbi:MAG: sulfotransferase domain-containing protein [Hyphomicrobiales bacterium]
MLNFWNRVNKSVAHKSYIGTFHKTGTVLFGGILRRAEKSNLLVPWYMHKASKPKKWTIGFDYTSIKLMELMKDNQTNSKYVICIRDPRDVIVSGAYYHTKSNEKWLHIPQKRFNGLTYQEKINSYMNMSDKFLFEMDYNAALTINDMLKVPQNKENVYITKLENLVQDYNLREYTKVYTALGFSGDLIAQLLLVSYNNSLFSGNVKIEGHVRSGKPKQYISEFSDTVLKRYYEIYGDSALKLGYDA